jgi:hypothetical protein
VDIAGGWFDSPELAPVADELPLLGHLDRQAAEPGDRCQCLLAAKPVPERWQPTTVPVRPIPP